MNRGAIRTTVVVLVFEGCLASSCSDLGDEEPQQSGIASDSALFDYIGRKDPFTSYPLFPNVDSVASGTLNGSSAHQPLVRVRLNAKAVSALHGGSLPSGTGFPDGSVILKEIIMQGKTVLYAVIVKDNANPFSAGGWLWGEYRTDGTPLFSLLLKGSGCVSCHSREQGLLHDLVRTFERQRPTE